MCTLCLHSSRRNRKKENGKEDGDEGRERRRRGERTEQRGREDEECRCEKPWGLMEVRA